MKKNSAQTYKLSRQEAQVLARYARQQKGMDLPEGWIAFWRLTPPAIAKQYPGLSVPEIVTAARLPISEAG